MSQEVFEEIKKDISSNKVFLYMKGSPDFPQCGFSARVVQILRESGAEFGSKDVLSNPAIRQGIKEFANWPTIPQLYVNGEFVGGCDIVTDLYTRGQLKDMLK